MRTRIALIVAIAAILSTPVFANSANAAANPPEFNITSLTRDCAIDSQKFTGVGTTNSSATYVEVTFQSVASRNASSDSVTLPGDGTFTLTGSASEPTGHLPNTADTFSYRADLYTKDFIGSFTGTVNLPACAVTTTTSSTTSSTSTSTSTSTTSTTQPTTTTSSTVPSTTSTSTSTTSSTVPETTSTTVPSTTSSTTSSTQPIVTTTTTAPSSSTTTAAVAPTTTAPVVQGDNIAATPVVATPQFTG